LAIKIVWVKEAILNKACNQGVMAK
jgi:hypothetical protein